jgi:hypothetical protein
LLRVALLQGIIPQGEHLFRGLGLLALLARFALEITSAHQRLQRGKQFAHSAIGASRSIS